MVIGADGGIIAGHGRVEAAKLLGIEEVPTLMLSQLSADERRAYILADNQLALNAGSDKDILAIKRQALIDVEFDLGLTSLVIAEIDLVLDEASSARDGAPEACRGGWCAAACRATGSGRKF